MRGEPSRGDRSMLKSLDAALQVLEALDGGAAERGVSDLARELGVSKAAIYRILVTLARRGYVTQNPVTSHYAIGPRLRRFSHVASSTLDLPSVARPFMIELRDATLDTVHLAVLEGSEAVYIAKEDGLHPVQVTSRVGARCPAHCVSTGKALLAYADVAVRERLVAAGLTRYTPLTHAEPDDFRQEMTRIHARGCAMNTGEWRTEVRGVAAPIFDSTGRAVASIGVCSPAQRMPDSRLGEACALVTDIASRLSLELGGAPRTVRGENDGRLPPPPEGGLRGEWGGQALMPVVTVNWLEGRTLAQKQELVSEITQLVHRVGGSPLERIAVVVHDVPAENWGQGGQLISSGQSAPPTTPLPATSISDRSPLHETAVSLPLIDQQVRMFDLEQPRFQGMPVIAGHQPGYAYFLYRRHGDDYRPDELGVRSSASGVIVCMEHSGTHIDAICHQADAQMLYGGIPAADVSGTKGFTAHAIEEVPPMLAPGVLLDAAAERGVRSLDAGYVVTAADLEACCRRQGVEIRPGDVVLVRTGNARFWDDPERFLAGPGMDGSAAEWLAAKGVLAVGADNMAWDVIGLRDPKVGCQLPGHLILIARHGIYIIENLQLEELAAAGHSRFTFICLPLKFIGATGSPVRPIAVVNT